MTGLLQRMLLLALALAAPAWCQFGLYLVNGSLEQPVPRTYDFGSVEPGSSATVPFRIRNVSTATATLDFLTVGGSGFSLGSQPPLPQSLAPQGAVDFTVVFQSAGTGSYSASLDSSSISVLLTANVPVELTCLLSTDEGVQPLAAAPVDFGAVSLGATATRHVTMLNQTSVALTAPGPLVTGPGFALSGPSPGGTPVAPTGSVAFDIQFDPTAAGAATGAVSIGARTYALTGTGVVAPLPNPRISLVPPPPGSAQQGAVAVNLDAPSLTAGSGTVTLTFLPAPPLPGATVDAGIAFASGGQSATFTVSPGDTQGHFGAGVTAPFQTGTTAGAVTLTAQLGGNTDEQSIIVLPAPVGVTAVQGVRSPGTIEVDLTGFDNTRTAGPLAFTFFDAAGKAMGTGAILADGTASFAAYFQNAAGGAFALQAVFPVVGDTTQIAAFEAAVTNSAGAATTARVNF